MAAAIKLFQGADRDIVVTHDDSDLTSATEIEVRIDTPDQIVKSLTEGGVSGVSASQFTVTIEDTDTETAPCGEYRIQTRSTKADVLTQGVFTPKVVRIVPSIFVNQGSGNDYN